MYIAKYRDGYSEAYYAEFGAEVGDNEQAPHKEIIEALMSDLRGQVGDNIAIEEVEFFECSKRKLHVEYKIV